MRTVFCKEELDLENEISSSSSSEVQLAICENLTTVFSYDAEESVNDLRRRNAIFIMQRFIVWRNILVHALWQVLNWKKNITDEKKRENPGENCIWRLSSYSKNVCNIIILVKIVIVMNWNNKVLDYVNVFVNMKH